MKKVIPIKSLLNRKCRDRPPLTDVDMMVELVKLRHATALLEIDLAQVKQRVLDEMVEQQGNRTNV
ncbi:hypothetical protein GH983_22955 (plasmid) [Agrobacterium sp. MA01]|uniref:hypothetical protein n=1 Tax=Agrobacterium sp. MA01 TaxID=2664893 RepID=UPI00129A360C|nr:hypothetical protein [Agrobacterium sp. MA01]QGG93400.1 hypothetical protein GH983_22955 [Agrobacterium sp. MA01]